MDSEFAEALAKVAPGTPLREGLERVLLAKSGALVILGDPPELLELCSGGFLIQAGYTPQKLYELAKMDGAIVVSEDLSKLVRANVHLVPDPRLPTTETGTRHRTAERVAESVPVTVVAVSEEQSTITVYHGSTKRTLQPLGTLLSRANQALSTLERYRNRLDGVLGALDLLEFNDQVRFQDVVSVFQRAEMVRRIRAEIDEYLLELGVDGRLVALQVAEISLGFNREYAGVIRDYLGLESDEEIQGFRATLGSLSSETVMNLSELAEVVYKSAKSQDLRTAYQGGEDPLRVLVSSRGSRVVAHIPRLPPEVGRALLGSIDSLEALRRSDEVTLASIPGMGPEWARVVRDYLSSRAN
jgi:diadenylate cyclase